MDTLEGRANSLHKLETLAAAPGLPRGARDEFEHYDERRGTWSAGCVSRAAGAGRPGPATTRARRPASVAQSGALGSDPGAEVRFLSGLCKTRGGGSGSGSGTPPAMGAWESRRDEERAPSIDAVQGSIAFHVGLHRDTVAERRGTRLQRAARRFESARCLSTSDDKRRSDEHDQDIRPVDPRSLEQLERCMAAGDAEFGVLCADHHPGYSQPIGGGIAYEGHISPSGVGYDIGSATRPPRPT